MEKAIGFVTEIRNQDPSRPFFLYVANNAVHGPLQAKEADLAKYRGRYDAGWDALRAARFQRQMAMGLVPAGSRLAERDPAVPGLGPCSRRPAALFARHMETYAAMLDCADQNIGRLVALLEELGELDNTIFVFTSDNGGTNSAGPAGALHFNRRYAGLPGLPVEVDLEREAWIGTGRGSAVYPMGWAQVSNTPFPSYKTYTGGGGRRVSFVVSWPDKLKDFGAVRRQFGHVIDVMPTLLDLAGVPALETSNGNPAKPMQGKSLAPVLRDADAPAPRSEQYYECWANRAYYRDGWVAVSLQKRGEAIDFDNWTLHAHAEDFSESMDLRRQHPQKLEELVAGLRRGRLGEHGLSARQPHTGAKIPGGAAASAACGHRSATVSAERPDRAPQCDRAADRQPEVSPSPRAFGTAPRTRACCSRSATSPAVWCFTSRTASCGSPITGLADFTRWPALRWRRANAVPRLNSRRSAGGAAAAGWSSMEATPASGTTKSWGLEQGRGTCTDTGFLRLGRVTSHESRAERSC